MRRHHDTAFSNEGKVRINVCLIDSAYSQISYLQYFLCKFDRSYRFSLSISVLPQNVVWILSQAGYFPSPSRCAFLFISTPFCLALRFARFLLSRKVRTFFSFWLMIVVTVIWSFMEVQPRRLTSTNWLKREWYLTVVISQHPCVRQHGIASILDCTR